MPGERVIAGAAGLLLLVSFTGGPEPSLQTPDDALYALRRVLGQAAADVRRQNDSLHRASRSRSQDRFAVLRAIRWCESRNDYRAKNPSSSASGAYGFIDSTWRDWCECDTRRYPRAWLAPEAVQDAAALRLFLGEGTDPWKASRGCWG